MCARLGPRIIWFTACFACFSFVTEAFGLPFGGRSAILPYSENIQKPDLCAKELSPGKWAGEYLCIPTIIPGNGPIKFLKFAGRVIRFASGQGFVIIKANPEFLYYSRSAADISHSILNRQGNCVTPDYLFMRRKDISAFQFGKRSLGYSDAAPCDDPQPECRHRQCQGREINKGYAREHGIRALVSGAGAFLFGLLSTLGLCRWKGW